MECIPIGNIQCVERCKERKIDCDTLANQLLCAQINGCGRCHYIWKQHMYYSDPNFFSK